MAGARRRTRRALAGGGSGVVWSSGFEAVAVAEPTFSVATISRRRLAMMSASFDGKPASAHKPTYQPGPFKIKVMRCRANFHHTQTQLTHQ